MANSIMERVAWNQLKSFGSDAYVTALENAWSNASNKTKVEVTSALGSEGYSIFFKNTAYATNGLRFDTTGVRLITRKTDGTWLQSEPLNVWWS